MKSDQDYLADFLDHDICYHLNRVYEEHNHLERQLNVEGNKHLSRIRESMSVVEAKTKERDRIKEKLNNSIEKQTNNNASGTTLPLSSESTRLQQKYAASEAVLQEAVRYGVPLCLLIPMQSVYIRILT